MGAAFPAPLPAPPDGPYDLAMSERSRNLPRRSCMSSPGSNEKFLTKAPTVAADMSFLDLEDSVAPLEKEAARVKVVDAIRNLPWDDRVLCVRIASATLARAASFSSGATESSRSRKLMSAATVGALARKRSLDPGEDMQERRGRLRERSDMARS